MFFVDAAHFVSAPFLAYLWCFVRCFIKAPAGRQRFNVLGALNAVTHELITVTNDAYINATSVCELLGKIAQANVGVPISLILENARYQKCAVVREVAESLKIELVYLPSYSPNLNLIERFWKFIKKEALYSKYYADFGAFSKAISDCISLAHRLKRSWATGSPTLGCVFRTKGTEKAKRPRFQMENTTLPFVRSGCSPAEPD